ncbi:uncharacterized protein Triagg1_5855 [Trichoderma aggressivum f. europaeum]|uniref:Uncharacterized protein n=1 Tax=Trichoderma aggressivum f. europaeum TaxID=173218 RepID=A0AAE1J8D5_9HYPO|nr:hypothetical protein Triagg1_5855 [Trichoderma aggressivum f. europaeum]
MSCKSLDPSSGICFASSNNLTLLLSTFKDCCDLAPIVQYYDSSIGCSAYCPLMPNGRKGRSLRDCLAENLKTASCFMPDDVAAAPGVIAQASKAAKEPVCSACAAASATTTTGAAVRMYSAETSSWKTGLTVGAVLFTGMFAGGFLI